MPNIARVPITNVYLGAIYAGQIVVAPKQRPVNVIQQAFWMLGFQRSPRYCFEPRFRRLR